MRSHGALASRKISCKLSDWDLNNGSHRFVAGGWFQRGRLDFPSRAFHRYIRNEALSFLVAAEEFESAHPSFSKHKLRQGS